jgi:hypothetical protein
MPQLSDRMVPFILPCSQMCVLNAIGNSVGWRYTQDRPSRISWPTRRRRRSAGATGSGTRMVAISSPDPS